MAAGYVNVPIKDGAGATRSVQFWDDGSGNLVPAPQGFAGANVLGSVTGPAASGAAVSGNPVLQGGSDGTNARTMLTDALGNQVMTGKGLAVTGTGAALNATPIAATDVGDMRYVTVQILNVAYSGTLAFQGSNDNTSWKNVYLGRTDNAPVPVSYVAAATVSDATYAGVLQYRYFRVLLSTYASGTATLSAWFTAVPPTPQTVQSNIYAGGAALASASNASDGIGTITGLAVVNLPYLSSGGSSWDRQRNNFEAIVLASAARTSSANSAQLTNYNARGVTLTISCTANASAAGITVAVKYFDTLSGTYVTLLQGVAIFAATATGAILMEVYPGCTPATNVSVSRALPRLWRVEVTNGDASSITYSISANYIL